MRVACETAIDECRVVRTRRGPKLPPARLAHNVRIQVGEMRVNRPERDSVTRSCSAVLRELAMSRDSGPFGIIIAILDAVFLCRSEDVIAHPNALPQCLVALV